MTNHYYPGDDLKYVSNNINEVKYVSNNIDEVKYVSNNINDIKHVSNDIKYVSNASFSPHLSESITKSDVWPLAASQQQQVFYLPDQENSFTFL